MTSVPTKLGAEFYRSLLTRQGRAFYDRLNARLLRGDLSGRTSFSVIDPRTAASDCFAAFKAVRDDHPEYFYLGFHSEFTLLGRVGTLRYPILYSGEDIRRIRYRLRRCIYQLVRGTAPLPVTEREELVYGRIAGRLSYADRGDAGDHSVVNPVLKASGVCEGQNALLLLCYRRVGVPCIKVYGRSRTDDRHCWTIAWIDGRPTHCDVTWDSGAVGGVRYDYLNLSDRRIAADHGGFGGRGIPECTAEGLDYYSRHGLLARIRREMRRCINRL